MDLRRPIDKKLLSEACSFVSRTLNFISTSYIKTRELKRPYRQRYHGSFRFLYLE